MKSVAIIGGGSASLICADLLSADFKVTIYEKGKSIGRKFLVAGKGGFNLAHNFEFDLLKEKYAPTLFMDKALQQFGVSELREWYANVGVPTFVGSSNRVFPEKGISPADVLHKIKAKLIKQNVEIQLQYEFVGFSENQLPILSSKNKTEELQADIYIFALGGGSWKVTGANSDWLAHFQKIGIKTKPYESSNCGLDIKWDSTISDFHIGKPLKNIAVKHGDFIQKGEALISDYGLEGNAIYPISASVRKSLANEEASVIKLDLKPNLTTDSILQKIKKAKPSNYGKLLKLDTTKMALVKNYISKEAFLDQELFATEIKNVEIQIESLRPVEEAISTVGGILTTELNSGFSLKSQPYIFCIGEMVDWDAPTGGFLLQGCFSMGALAAKEIIKHKKPIKKLS